MQNVLPVMSHLSVNIDYDFFVSKKKAFLTQISSNFNGPGKRKTVQHIWNCLHLCLRLELQNDLIISRLGSLSFPWHPLWHMYVSGEPKSLKE